MFEWSPDSVRFQRDSAEYTGSYDVLAAHAAGKLAKGSSVFEGGCGLGHLSLALAKRGFALTAMDISSLAIESFRRDAERFAVSPVILEGDLFSLPESMTFDCAVFSFFGSTDEMLRWAKLHACNRLICFKKNWDTHRFTRDPGSIRKYTYPLTCEDLVQLGVPFQSEVFDVDMGQPFRSIEDAVLFFRLHDPEGNMEKEDIMPRLTETDDRVFPYYLPARRSVGMIAVSVDEIPNTVII